MGNDDCWNDCNKEDKIISYIINKTLEMNMKVFYLYICNLNCPTLDTNI